MPGAPTWRVTQSTMRLTASVRYEGLPCPRKWWSSPGYSTSSAGVSQERVKNRVALLALTVFGGESVRAFAVTMFFGIAVGTFSSIYIAGPVLILFRLRPDRYRLKGGGSPAAKA